MCMRDSDNLAPGFGGQISYRPCLLSYAELSECPLDPGGYFIINGSEKVIIAQEKMATNGVYVFQKKSNKYAFTSECRSCLENSSRPTSTMWVHLMTRGGSVSGKCFKLSSTH